MSLDMRSCWFAIAIRVATGISDSVVERLDGRSFEADPVSFVFLLVVASSIMVMGFRVFSPKKPRR